MSFLDLYNNRQQFSGRIKRTQVLELVREHSGKDLTYFITGKITIDICRGMFLGVDDPQRPEFKWAVGKNLIAIARGNNRCWQRMVLFKECMHLFDEPLQKVGTEDSFEDLIDTFVATSPGQRAPGMESEIVAFWMGLSMFASESERVELVQSRTSGEITDPQIAEKLKMPLQYVPNFMGEAYRSSISLILKR